jgi:hypothetical protein
MIGMLYLLSVVHLLDAGLVPFLARNEFTRFLNILAGQILIPVKDALIALMLARLYLHQGIKSMERDGLKHNGGPF